MKYSQTTAFNMFCYEEKKVCNNLKKERFVYMNHPNSCLLFGLLPQLTQYEVLCSVQCDKKQ